MFASPRRPRIADPERPNQSARSERVSEDSPLPRCTARRAVLTRRLLPALAVVALTVASAALAGTALTPTRLTAPPTAVLGSLGSGGGTLTWTQLSPSVSPAARAGAGSAYDPALGGILLFGGCTSGHYWNFTCSPTNDTWLFKGGSWTPLSPAHAPTARLYPAMAYDSSDGYALLFGGSTGGSTHLALNDTWEFNGTDWVALSPTVTPPARYAAAFVDDPSISAVLLYGGLITNAPDTGPAGNDTWEFSGGSWAPVNTTGPSGRFSSAAWYDPTCGCVDLFGGSTNQPTWGSYGELWAFGTNGTWTLTNSGGNGTPGARNGAVATFDAQLRSTVMVDGHDSWTYYNETWLAANGSWLRPNLSALPSFGWGMTLQYDPATNATILFGGYDYTGGLPVNPADEIYLGGTWELAGGNGTGGSSGGGGPSGTAAWIQLSPSTAPSARAGAGSAYDPALGGILLFGGCTGGHYWNYTCSPTNDTWLFRGGNWSQLAPAHSPSARVSAAMVYDSADDYVLLFGGSTGGLTHRALNDTWEFNGSDWVALRPSTSPSARYAAAMVDDPALGAVVLYGGLDSNNPDTGPAANDTWQYSAGTWSFATASGPVGRFSASVWYDPLIGCVELFGGSTNQPTWGNFGERWAYCSVGNWTLSASGGTGTPAARNGAGATFDARLHSAVMVDGHNAWTYDNQTWLIGNGSWFYENLTVLPPFSWGMTLQYDPAINATILFGGYDYTGGWPVDPAADFYLDGTWELAAGNGTGGSSGGTGGSGGGNSSPATTPLAWTRLTPGSSPSARAGAGSAYDPVLGGILLFGGCPSGHYWNFTCSPTNDTWLFKGGNWSRLTPAHSPSARLSAGMAYDSLDGYVLLFGGSTGGLSHLALNDTWEFNGTDWVALAPSSSPSARYAAAMVDDPALSSVVLFGGLASNDPDLGAAANDTWEYSSGSWTRVTASGPTARFTATSWYDPTSGCLELFGGSTNVPTWHNFADQWSFCASGTWTLVSGGNSTMPGARNGAVATYDPRFSAAVLVDGHDAYTFYNETWLFGNGSWVLGNPLIAPPFSWGMTVQFDAAANTTILFGGYDYSAGWPVNPAGDLYLGETWELTNGNGSTGGGGSSGGNGSGGNGTGGSGSGGGGSGGGNGSGNGSGGNGSNPPPPPKTSPNPSKPGGLSTTGGWFSLPDARLWGILVLIGVGAGVLLGWTLRRRPPKAGRAPGDPPPASAGLTATPLSPASANAQPDRSPIAGDPPLPSEPSTS